MDSDGERMQKNKKKFHFDNVYIENPMPYEDILLYQIGDISCEGGYVIGEHIQQCYEISYIVSGKGIFCSDGHYYNVKKGDIYINKPGESHDGIADTIDPFRYFYLGYIFKEKNGERNSLLGIKKMFDQVVNPVLSDKFNISESFINIFREILNIGEYNDLMVKTCLHQIVILAFRNFFSDFRFRYTPEDNMEKSKKIAYEIVNYIDTHIKDLSELSQIANNLSYSYSYLSRVFSLEIGISIQEYCQKKTI